MTEDEKMLYVDRVCDSTRDLTREQWTAILGFDPGPGDATPGKPGVVTKIDRVTGVATVTYG